LGEPAGVAQSVAKKRDRFLARFVAGLLAHAPPHLGAQTRAMERGSMRQTDPMAPGLERRGCLEHGVMKSMG